MIFKKKNVKICPPIGYDFRNDTGIDIGIDINDVELLRTIAMGMVNDEKFKDLMKNETHEGLLDFYKENGFQFVEE